MRGGYGKPCRRCVGNNEHQRIDDVTNVTDRKYPTIFYHLRQVSSKYRRDLRLYTATTDRIITQNTNTHMYAAFTVLSTTHFLKSR